jgi:hypothetical protein
MVTLRTCGIGRFFGGNRVVAGRSASLLGNTSSSQSADTVPGEKVQDDRFVPAASPGASGKVQW